MLFNPQCQITSYTIGEEDIPLLVIDDLVTEPSALVDFADNQTQFRKRQEDFYPGVRGDLPRQYVSSITKELSNILRQQLKAQALTLQAQFSAYSLTTERPETLAPIQCIPHFDSADAHQFAFVHYLFHEDLGGTSFYRHKKTGLVSITAQTVDSYMNTLKSQATTVGLPKMEYINGDTPLFGLEKTVSAKFNRGLIYPSNVLHSGNIDIAKGLSSSPVKGRLTANMALQVSALSADLV